MKLKHFLVIFCLIGAGFSQLSAQNGNKENGNKAQSYISYDEPWQIDVYCEGEHVDHIEGTGWVHFVSKNKGGEPIWERRNSHMTAESTWGSGEKFKYIETSIAPYYALVYPVVWIEEMNYQLIGDQGHHYVGTLTVVVTIIGFDPDDKPIVDIEFIPGENNHCL